MPSAATTDTDGSSAKGPVDPAKTVGGRRCKQPPGAGRQLPRGNDSSPPAPAVSTPKIVSRKKSAAPGTASSQHSTPAQALAPTPIAKKQRLSATKPAPSAVVAQRPTATMLDDRRQDIPQTGVDLRKFLTMDTASLALGVSATG